MSSILLRQTLRLIVATWNVQGSWSGRQKSAKLPGSLLTLPIRTLTGSDDFLPSRPVLPPVGFYSWLPGLCSGVPAGTGGLDTRAITNAAPRLDFLSRTF